ncbi:tektin-4 [Drosophila grimshawi]|uniref:Tektin n=1 Tax=Drosophila grimshawi TaxID=7222 RepID=B4JWL7_DROGR|nr:tektin-4 [Drosophila grimshawi]EDV98355.1 GH22717 [Drosophila grimshawi]
MPFNSVVTIEKPLQHLSLTDWNARVDRLRSVANARHSDTFDMRNSSRQLRNEVRIEGNWATYESNEALDGRIVELNSWREIISKTLERFENEITLLQDEKTLTERELDALAGPIAVISEMLTMRDSRLGSEITYDDPDKEIKNELAILENNQQLLAERCQKAWEKLTRLEEVRNKIVTEIENKVDAVHVEMAQRALDRDSTKISLKLGPRRAPIDSYEEWLAKTKNLKQLAENELADTAALRESLFVCREKARSMLKAQQERTEYSIRKRIFETQRAHNELEWLSDKLQTEIENAEHEIRTLEKTLDGTVGSLKLAETRLENRFERCSAEQCLDYVHDMLSHEVDKICDIRRCLQAKIADAKANFNLITEHVARIRVDLEKKHHALMTDKRTLELRQRLKDDETGVKVCNPCAQTDRNIVITNAEYLIPKT